MTTSSDLSMLMRYGAWANQRLYEALAGLPPETLAAPRPGRPHGILGVLGHIVTVDRIWRSHLTGVPHGLTIRNFDTLSGLTELRGQQCVSDAWYIAHTEAQDEFSLSRVIDFHFIDGDPGSMRHADILLHVANHKTYHRGYIADMLYDIGFAPPTMDLPVYLRAPL